MPTQSVVTSDGHQEQVMQGAAACSPLELQLRRTRISSIVAGVMVAACFVWAVWPAPSRDQPQGTVQDVTQAAAQAPAAMWDAAAFDAPLWEVPKEQVVAVVSPPPPPPPPPPLRLQLIAIMHVPQDGDARTNSGAKQANSSAPVLNAAGAYRAALYDPDSDATSVVGVGDVIGGRRVTAVDAHRITLVLGELPQSLTLDAGTPAEQMPRAESGGRVGRGGVR